MEISGVRLVDLEDINITLQWFHISDSMQYGCQLMFDMYESVSVLPNLNLQELDIKSDQKEPKFAGLL